MIPVTDEWVENGRKHRWCCGTGNKCILRSHSRAINPANRRLGRLLPLQDLIDCHLAPFFYGDNLVDGLESGHRDINDIISRP